MEIPRYFTAGTPKASTRSSSRNALRTPQKLAASIHYYLLRGFPERRFGDSIKHLPCPPKTHCGYPPEKLRMLPKTRRGTRQIYRGRSKYAASTPKTLCGYSPNNARGAVRSLRYAPKLAADGTRRLKSIFPDIKYIRTHCGYP